MAVKARKAKTPKSVAIVAMGKSHTAYTSACAVLASRRLVADETWAINAMAGCIQYDRVFMLDSPGRLAKASAGYRKLLSANDPSKPIYTSHIRFVMDRFPGVTDYPLEDVINSIGFSYLNGTVAYAVAYAITIGVKKIMLYGCDYSYPNQHEAESGRGCVEFLIGIAVSRGIEIVVGEGSSLLDTNVAAEKKFYGYECPVEITLGKDGRYKVRFVEDDTKET